MMEKQPWSQSPGQGAWGEPGPCKGVLPPLCRPSELNSFNVWLLKQGLQRLQPPVQAQCPMSCQAGPLNICSGAHGTPGHSGRTSTKSECTRLPGPWRLSHPHTLTAWAEVSVLPKAPGSPSIQREKHPSFLLQLLLLYLDQALALPRPGEWVCCRRAENTGLGASWNWVPALLCCVSLAHGIDSLSLILLLSQVPNDSFLDERDKKRASPLVPATTTFLLTKHSILKNKQNTHTHTHTHDPDGI